MAYFVYQQVDRGCQEEVHELSQKVKPFGQEEYQRRKRLIQPGRERVPAFQRPPKIARTFLSLFFEHHEGLARWHAKAWDEIECTEVAEGRTILGRRRLIDPEASNWDKVHLDPSAVELLIDKGYDPTYGARPMRRAVEKYLEDPLAEELLRGNIKQGDTLDVHTAGQQLAFKVAGAGTG